MVDISHRQEGIFVGGIYNKNRQFSYFILKIPINFFIYPSRAEKLFILYTYFIINLTKLRAFNFFVVGIESLYE